MKITRRQLRRLIKEASEIDNDLTKLRFRVMEITDDQISSHGAKIINELKRLGYNVSGDTFSTSSKSWFKLKKKTQRRSGMPVDDQFASYKRAIIKHKLLDILAPNRDSSLKSAVHKYLFKLCDTMDVDALIYYAEIPEDKNDDGKFESSHMAMYGYFKNVEGDPDGVILKEESVSGILEKFLNNFSISKN
jgi:hypothetical protein